jgi:hypothetical protein
MEAYFKVAWAAVKQRIIGIILDIDRIMEIE